VLGNTYSNNFPVLSIQNSLGGDGDAFLTKLNKTGSQLVHSTYMGGAQVDVA